MVIGSAAPLPHGRGVTPRPGDGRRRRPASDATLIEDLAWVLSNAREHAVDPVLRTAAGMARSGLEPSVHRSQVGRWESGETPASFDVVSRYERALGLPERQLVMTIELLARHHDPAGVVPFLDRPMTSDWLHRSKAFLDRAYTDDVLRGAEWDDLSAMLVGHPEVVMRDEDWGHLLERCLTESMVSTGLEFLLRAEAMARIASHPQSTDAVIAISRRALADPSTQIFESLGLLLHCDNPAAYDVLLEALDDGHLQEPATWAAFYTLAGLASLDRLGKVQRARAGRHALEAVSDVGSTIRVARNAAACLRALDPPARRQMITVLKATSRARIARVLDDGGVLADAEAQALVKRIEQELSLVLGPATAWPRTVRRLIETVTSVTHEESRGFALSVLLLISQGRTVGSIYVTELRTSLAAGQAVLADDCLSVLSWLLPYGDLPELLALALDPLQSTTVAMQAAVAIGNARPSGQPAFWAATMAREGRRSRPVPLSEADIAGQVAAAAAVRMTTPGGDPEPLARGFCYLLGMYGRFDLLAGLDARARSVADDGVRAAWQSAIGWWTSLPAWARPASQLP